MHVHLLYNITSVENTGTHQMIPKILLGLMSTILSPQVHSSNNETEQQQSFFLRTRSVVVFFLTTRSRKLLLKTRLDKHDFM